MIRRLLTLFFFLGGWTILYMACCGENFPHFDYNQLQIGLYDDTRPNPGDSLIVLFLAPDSLTYLAGGYELTLSTPLFGTSCPSRGEDGPVHTVAQFELSAEQEIDAAHPAGTSLNDLFYLIAADSVYTLEGALPEYFQFSRPDDFLLIGTPYKTPDTTKIFTLNARLTKSDGAVSTGQLQGFRFR